MKASSLLPHYDNGRIQASLSVMKYPLRMSSLLLFTLSVVSVYIVLTAGTSIRGVVSNRADEARRSWQHAIHQYADEQRLKNPHLASLSPPLRVPITLNAEEELAALTSFLLGAHHSLPSLVDPALPIDPQLILDFDPRAANAEHELEEMAHNVWTVNPVIVFLKTRSRETREVRKLLTDFHMKPTVTFFEVDERDDADVLMAVLARLTGSTALPIILVGGQEFDFSTFQHFAESGELEQVLSDAGIHFNIAQKKQKAVMKHLPALHAPV